MEDQACPRCKTTKYRNPSLKLMVNVCGHALCENCVELLFIRGSGTCPECGSALRRNDFRLQLFEDAFVEKEVDIRKKILKDYNKKEQDFATLRDYNDYLEEIENIVFNLANGVEVEETRRKVDIYKKENQAVIKKNRVKLSRDEELLETLIEQERHEHEMHVQHAKEEEIQEQREKRKNKEDLLDQLMSSTLPADHIFALNVKKEQDRVAAAASKPQPVFSSGIRLGKQDAFMEVPKKVEGEVYVYQPLAFDMFGPDTPAWSDLEVKGYLGYIRPASDLETAGGFKAELACQRALQDAFAGLYFSPVDYFSSHPTTSEHSQVTDMEVT